jgi:hypothetical protein
MAKIVQVHHLFIIGWNIHLTIAKRIAKCSSSSFPPQFAAKPDLVN